MSGIFRLWLAALLGLLPLAVPGNGQQPTAADSTLFTDATTTHLPVDDLDGLSMDARPGDLDGDGDLDLFIANEFRRNILLLNDGLGVFANGSAQVPPTTRDSEDAALADFDLDGDLDAVIVSEDDRINEFFVNDGDAAFAATTGRFPSHGISNAVLAPDIDSDGTADLLIGNGGPDGAQNLLFLNDGTGFFTDATDRLPARRDTTQDVEWGDIDNDGDADILLGNEDANRLLINDGSGTFAEGDPAALPLRQAIEETREADLGDIDGDGDLDAYFANVVLFNRGTPASRQNRLLLNDGSGRFTDRTGGLPPDDDNSFDADFVDLDQDGDLDIITGNAFPDQQYRVYENDGSGVFTDATARVLPPGIRGSGFDIEAADYNADGRIDLYLAGRGTPDLLLLGRPLPTSVEAPAEPDRFALEANYPNPFNSGTTIPFQLDRTGIVQLHIFNLAGQPVRTLAEWPLPSGAHRVGWDGRDQRGQALASGAYIYRLRQGERVATGKLLLLR
ncbi:MAG: T9SS type A sorting domain-containing protein [Candidatus Latescibacteria bacterium]|nr:T9SS type A sorting domain-containing protein [Candidatus Latescibacterota bacterium]